jgi:zinc/manganese transport system substrate-binding protein
MKKFLLPFLLPVLLTVLFTPSAHAKVQVVATLQWIGSVAKEIGGDKVEVVSLVKGNQDPHLVEAKPSMILAVRKADILMYNGLDLEIGYLPVLIESSRNAKVQPGRPGNFDCSRFVEVIEKPETIDRSMGDVHPLGNPHYHYSARNISNIAAGMAKALSESDPADASYFQGNLKAFQARVREARDRWDTRRFTGRKYVAYHKYFEYLARELGFAIVAYVEPKPGIPPSAGHIEKLIGSMEKDRPDGILVTSYYGLREVEFLSRKTGVPYFVVPHDVGGPPEAKDWFTMMDLALKSLK